MLPINMISTKNDPPKLTGNPSRQLLPFFANHLILMVAMRRLKLQRLMMILEGARMDMERNTILAKCIILTVPYDAITSNCSSTGRHLIPSHRQSRSSGTNYPRMRKRPFSSRGSHRHTTPSDRVPPPPPLSSIAFTMCSSATHPPVFSERQVNFSDTTTDVPGNYVRKDYATDGVDNPQINHTGSFLNTIEVHRLHLRDIYRVLSRPSPGTTADIGASYKG